MRCLSYYDLLLYGLGANIGANFFLIIGMLLPIAGPSVFISFLMGGMITLITASCFAELSSRIPTNGGQYSYVYIYYGECLGWMYVHIS
jgi:APA family basic amino acid/polyamine antiporter